MIDPPWEAVWAFSMDLTKIPEFHPRVFKVDLIDGRTFREVGVSYQSHLSGGKHTYIEKDIEIFPLEKIVTALPQDTLGISKVLSDYTVETTFQKLAIPQRRWESATTPRRPRMSGCMGFCFEQHGIYVIYAKSANRDVLRAGKTKNRCWGSAPCGTVQHPAMVPRLPRYVNRFVRVRLTIRHPRLTGVRAPAQAAPDGVPMLKS